MGLFSRVRRLNGSAQAAESTPPAPPADDAQPLDAAPPASAVRAPRAAAPSVTSLREGLQQLYSIRPSRDAFAEEAVKLIAKSAGARAAALLGYEQRGGRLHLLGHAGLDAEAVQILGGDAMVSAWDIPLRSLRNRRINVIEAAHENPFVPKPLVAISPRRLTIAALPFFHANAPIGVVVLFSPTPRGFADGLLKGLSQSLRVCALALAELPAAGAAAPRRDEEEAARAQPNLLRGLAALKTELARLTDALEESERQRATETAERVTAQSFLHAAQERSAQLEQELAEVRAAGERLPAVEKEIQGLSRRLAAASEAADTARTQVTELQAASAQSEQRAARESATIAELTGLRTQLEQQLEAARAAGIGLQTRLAEQVEANGRLAAERAELLARIETLAAGGESLERERQAAVNAAHRRVADMDAEIARLTAALDAAHTHGAEEINRTRHDAAATLDGLRAELADAVRARDELQRALGAAQQELGSHQRALAEMAAERTRLAAEAEHAHAERNALTTHVDTATAERAALERELRTVREQDLGGLETQLAGERESRRLSEEAFAAAESGYRQEIAELRDRLAAFDQEQTRLAKALEAKELLLQSAEENLTAAIDLSGEASDEDSVLDIDRDSAPEGVTASPELDLIVDADAAAHGDCILLDGDDIAGAAVRQLAEFGHRVSTLTPTPEAPGALKNRTVACAALNLAAPNAWTMVRHLRNGSGIARMPLIAYAMAANAPKGFWLGPVDFAMLPVAQTDLVEMLTRLVPTVKRVLAMSNDIDVMSDVRTQLSNARISTAVVLDGRQALDLVPTIRPEAAVLHLSPTCADVFRAIAGLRSAEISRDIPIVFLLDAQAQPREDAFLTAGLRMLTGRGDLVPHSLVDSLASAFEPYRVVA
jgi:predicted  nucleic acid-binding Zn-ribbon protein